MATKKSVLQLSILEEKIRKKVFVIVSKFTGVTSITIDEKTWKLTILGHVDVPIIVMKLRKICNAEIVSVEVAKPPEKKPEPEKKPDPKPVELAPMNYVYNPPAYAYAYEDSNDQSIQCVVL